MRDRVADAMWLIWRAWYPLMIYAFIHMGTAAVLQAAGFSPYGEDAVASTAVAAFLTAAPLIILYRRVRIPAEKHRCRNLRAGFWSVLTGIGSCFFLNHLITLTGLTSEAYQEASALLYRPPFAIQIAAVGFMIPVTEELIFRGLGYFRIRGKLSFFGAALSSALYFGWYHGNIVQGVYAFCIGLLLAGVYEAYQSLWAPICLHVAANLSSVLFTELVPDEIQFRILPIPMILLSGAVMILGIHNIKRGREQT